MVEDGIDLNPYLPIRCIVTVVLKADTNFSRFLSRWKYESDQLLGTFSLERIVNNDPSPDVMIIVFTLSNDRVDFHGDREAVAFPH